MKTLCLGQRAHVAIDKSSSQPAIYTCHQKRLIVAKFVKMKPSQNYSGHSRASSSPKNLQCIAGGAAEVRDNIQSTNHSPSEWTCCRVTAPHPQPNEPCWQTLLLTGAPGCPAGDCAKEAHCSAAWSMAPVG